MAVKSMTDLNGNTITVTPNGLIKVVKNLLQKLPQLPIFPIVEYVAPNIYAFDVSCLIGNPAWFLLYYMANPFQTAKNRAIATKGQISGLFQSIDEFPYASTAQGGLGSKAQPVPAWENFVQGGFLGSFYFWGMYGIPGQFIVVPVPS